MRGAAPSTGAAAELAGGTQRVLGDQASGKGSGALDRAWDTPGGRCWGGCWRRWRRWRGAVSAAAASGDER